MLTGLGQLGQSLCRQSASLLQCWALLISSNASARIFRHSFLSRLLEQPPQSGAARAQAERAARVERSQREVIIQVLRELSYHGSTRRVDHEGLDPRGEVA